MSVDTIFIVMAEVDYGGSHILGIFTRLDKAEQCELHGGERFTIDEYACSGSGEMGSISSRLFTPAEQKRKYPKKPKAKK